MTSAAVCVLSIGRGCCKTQGCACRHRGRHLKKKTLPKHSAKGGASLLIREISSNACCKPVGCRSTDRWSYNCRQLPVAPAGDGFDPQRWALTGRHCPMWSRGWREERRSG